MSYKQFNFIWLAAFEHEIKNRSYWFFINYSILFKPVYHYKLEYIRNVFSTYVKHSGNHFLINAIHFVTVLFIDKTIKHEILFATYPLIYSGVSLLIGSHIAQGTANFARTF